MQLNMTTQVLGACALFPTILYPLAKRYTNWPQAILGLTFNWSALLGWSAVLCTPAAMASLNLFSFAPAAVLYAGSFSWTLFYDTIYAFQDKKHDEAAGIKSTAVWLNRRKYLWLTGFATATTANLALFGWLTNQEQIYYIMLGAIGVHFVKQMAMVNFNSPQSCMKQFKSNNVIGALVAFGLFASLAIK